jgi:hypothetical protein
MATHPIRALYQPSDHPLVQASCGTVVNVFGTSGTLQAGIPEPPLQSPVLPPVPLPVHQQRKSLLEAELAGLWILLLLG